LNRRVANPVIRRFAGSFGPFALVRHQGRCTGRTYTTPVLAFGTPDQLFVAVLYGADSDWVRNVLEAGHAEVRWHRESRDYRHVELITRDQALTTGPRGAAWRLPAAWRTELRRSGRLLDLSVMGDATA
jgi:deazaflavin-dependent oxidoreductase (nitroreductase family)